jgi:NADH-quinone oxidoreductase subunit A
MVALLFLVFDVETIFIFPWLAIYQEAIGELGLARALFPMLAFLSVLVIGLVWAWRNGAVEWIRSSRASTRALGEEQS